MARAVAAGRRPGSAPGSSASWRSASRGSSARPAKAGAAQCADRARIAGGCSPRSSGSMPGSATQLGDELLERVRKEPRNAAWLWALGRLGARAPLYGPLNSRRRPRRRRTLDRAAASASKEMSADRAQCIAHIGARTGDGARDVSDAVAAAAAERLASAGFAEAAARLRVVAERVGVGDRPAVRGGLARGAEAAVIVPASRSPRQPATGNWTADALTRRQQLAHDRDDVVGQHRLFDERGAAGAGGRGLVGGITDALRATTGMSRVAAIRLSAAARSRCRGSRAATGRP